MFLKKLLVIGLIALLLLSSVSAITVIHKNNKDNVVEKEQEREECSVFSLDACILNAIIDFIVLVVNVPSATLLKLNKNLLVSEGEINSFYKIWRLMIYVLSLFLCLILVFAGFCFITAGGDMIKRENAKIWLKNAITMIVLLQCSFFIYTITLQISTILTKSIFNMINFDFFVIASNFKSAILDLVLAPVYLGVLLSTAVILCLRYVIISAGVLLLPFGIFFYFIPPLKPYGSLINNFIFSNIFVTFFASLILFVFSKIAYLNVFRNMKIIVTITAFFTVDLIIILLMLFVVIKSALMIIGVVMGWNSKISFVKQLIPAQQTTRNTFRTR